MKKFWNWMKDQTGEETVLRIEGPIDDEAWWGDEFTVKDLAESLSDKSGDITVWINSPGGNVFAAAQMYNLLKDYKGKVTVKIDALAASAATVVAMGGDEVLMSPVAIFMIHNPMTIAMGNEKDMQEAINTLRAVKDSIINAYAAKSGKSAKQIAKLMDGENGEGTWMDAKRAMKEGLIDGILFDADEEEEGQNPVFPPRPDDPEEPEEEEEEDEVTAKAHNAARKQYEDFVTEVMRNAHSGLAFRNDASAEETVDAVTAATEDSGADENAITNEGEGSEGGEEESPGRSRQRREEPEEETDEETDEESGEDENGEEEQPGRSRQRREEATEDKVAMPKPVFDENGMTADGKMSYTILADKLDALR